MEPLESEYRMLPVKNYIVFYVVTEHEVEIHRIIYAKMNIVNHINKGWVSKKNLKWKCQNLDLWRFSGKLGDYCIFSWPLGKLGFYENRNSYEQGLAK